MKILHCDSCGEKIVGNQGEILQVGNRTYDVHKACADKIKALLSGGEAVATPLQTGQWNPYTAPYVPVTIVPNIWPDNTPTWPKHWPTITCHNSASIH